MAIVAAAAQVQVNPSPPPPARRTVAWLACVFYAWTAVICLLVASMWLLVGGMATNEIVWLACGPDCAVATAAAKVFFVAGITIVLLFPFSLLGPRMMARAQTAAVVPVAAAAAAAATDIQATKERALTLKTCYAAMRRALRDPVFLWMLASIAFALLMIIALLVVGDNPVMGSRRAITCSVIYHAGAVGMNAVNCFVLCPFITLTVWRSWRKARRAL